MKAVGAAAMRALDARAVKEVGVSGETLMERAGAGLAFETARFAEALPARHARRFVLLAGKGNNGGDVFVAARHLKELCPKLGQTLHCVCPPEQLSGDAARMYSKLPRELKPRTDFSANDLQEGDIIVDGLLGTGAAGPLREPFAAWIKIVNEAALPVVAVDIPSGLNADDGSVASCAIHADLTVAMALPKTGMLTGKGPGLCGRVRIADIGIPKSFVEDAPSQLESTFAADIRPFFGREAFDAYKFARGHVLVIGGSRLYPGAPALSANAAIKAGAGLVTLAMPEGVRPHGALPNALIFRALPNPGAGFFGEASIPSLRELMEKADAIAVGPGLSQEKACASVVRAAVESGKPLVLDADALNLLAETPELLRGLKAPAILTPHPGEMKRLADGFEIKLSDSADRLGLAKELAYESGAAVILKGPRSVVASSAGRCALNGSGTSALATAGSGDTLTGLCVAFLARGLDAFDAARAGAFVHGLAGELGRPCGSRGLCADELPALIEKALLEISPLA